MLSEIKDGSDYHRSFDKVVCTVLFCGHNVVVYTIKYTAYEFTIERQRFCEEWSEIPPEPEKLYQITAKGRGETRPYVYGHLYKGKEDFLSDRSYKESDFEFIKLREVDL